MSKPTQVPKFGNWDANDQMPFTVVFEKARADHKGGPGAGNKLINPNDPSENLAAFGRKATEAPISSQRSSQQHYYADESDQRVETARAAENVSGGPLRSTMYEHAKKGSYGGMHDSERMGLGEGHFTEKSHSYQSSPYNARLGNRPAVPSHLTLDKRGPREGGTPPHQPARTHLRPASRGEDMFPVRALALPKFGAWDEKDPTSGDGFTVIFSHARNEKIGGPTQIPALQSDSPLEADFGDAYKTPHQPFYRKLERWVCCFRACDPTV